MPELQSWTAAPLSTSISSLDAGVSVNAEDRPHGAGEIGILKTSALNGGIFQPTQNKAVWPSERGLVAEPVRADSILFSRMNTPALVGESCHVAEDWPTLFLPDRIWQLKPKDRDTVSMRWLSYVLRSAPTRAHIETHATGTSGSMKNLSKSKLLDLAVLFPPIEEQRVIACVLDILDTTIRQTEATVEKLKQVRQGLLHELLTRGVDANGEVRPPQSEAPHLYKESVLGWLSREWEASTVDAEFEVASGITLGPHRAPRLRPRNYLRVANVQRARLELSDVAQLEASDTEMATRQLIPGDLLVVEGHASTQEIGRCAMAGESVRGFTFQNHLFRLRAKRLNASYGLHWMNSNFVQGYWRREAVTSSGLNTINRSKLSRVLVAVPSIAEQCRIVAAAEAIEQRIDREVVYVLKLKKQKSGLMDDLLTGRVRVTSLLG